MADPKNTTLQNPADMLTEGLPIPTADPNTPLPSTEQNQQDTIEEQQRQAKIQADLDKKRNEMLSQTRTGVASKEITDLEAQSEILQDIKRKEADEARIKSDEDLDRLAEKAKTDALINEYKNLKQEYTQRGLDFKTDPALEALLAEQEQVQEATQQQAIEAQQQQLIEEQQKEQMKEEMAVQAEKVAIKQEAINQKAIQKAVVEESLADQRQNFDLQKKMEEEDKSQDFTNYSEFWESRSTGQKILAGIALFLGSAGGRSGNSALKVLNDSIERNIQAKNTAKEEYWKQKEYGLKVTAEEIKRMGANTANDALKLKYAQLNQELMKEAQKAHNMRAINERLSQSRPLTSEEVFDLRSVNPDLEVDRFVTVGETIDPVTGVAKPKFMYAPTGGKEDLKKLREVLLAGQKSSNDLKTLQEIADMPFGGAFDLFKARPIAAAAVQSLIGNMRIDLFGPGILTDMEMKIAQNMIRNPTKVMSIAEANKNSLNFMAQKVVFGVREKMKQVGIQPPPSENDKNIAALMKAGLPKAEAINTLIKSNKWKKDSLTGF